MAIQRRTFPVGGSHLPEIVSETPPVVIGDSANMPRVVSDESTTSTAAPPAQSTQSSDPQADESESTAPTAVVPAHGKRAEPKAVRVATRRKASTALQMPGYVMIAAVMLLIIGTTVRSFVNLPDLLFGVVLMVASIMLMVGFMNTSVFNKLAPAKYPVPSRVPTLRPRSWLWKLGCRWIYRRSGWQRLAALSKWERERLADDELWKLRKVQKLYAVANTKGDAGKTTVTAWFAGIMSVSTQRHVIAFDVNESPGGTAKRFGIARKDTIRIRDYLAICQSLWSYKRLSAVVDWQRHSGVTVIASDEASSRFKLYDFIRGLWKCTEHAQNVFTDLGNAILAEGNLGSMIMCDTVLSVASITSPDSFDDLASTHRIFGGLGFDDKIRKGIVVILGDKQNKRADYAAQYGFPLDRVFVVPNDKYMRDSGVIDLNKIGRLTRVVLKEGLIAAIKAEPAKTHEYDPELIPMDPDSVLQLPTNHKTETDETS